ncbi:hypothetical protein KUTeg_023603 [Tegillarca granosa]|uniref:UDENN domain-containing protein n=1 Tax=Tegillarca granosa TaxID=220873 RepID=A0ABQ9E248_TEGGR|nr:hypothetical protein KUTeg_023603 [Tegillarca granosa]
MIKRHIKIISTYVINYLFYDVHNLTKSVLWLPRYCNEKDWNFKQNLDDDKGGHLYLIKINTIAFIRFLLEQAKMFEIYEINSSSMVDMWSSSKPLGDAVKSKLGGLKKKLFSPDPNIRPKMESQMDTLRSRKKKLQIVKQRISLAFAVLDTWKRELEKEEETSTSTDEDSLVDVKEIVKRIEHCTLVRQRTFKGIHKTRQVQQQIYPQLFDYALIVTLQPKEDSTHYEPKIIYKFPDHLTCKSARIPLRKVIIDKDGLFTHGTSVLEPNISVPQFCFPDALDFDVKSASPAAKSESYSFVLTNEDGERVYGYCRRFVVLLYLVFRQHMLRSKPIRTPAGLPEVVCIISPVNASNMYNYLLDEIEKHRQVNLETAQELIAAAFGRPLPNPGNVVHVRTLVRTYIGIGLIPFICFCSLDYLSNSCSIAQRYYSMDEEGEMGTIFLKRSLDSRVDNVNCDFLLKLGYDKLMKIFSCILLERSVLFCAKHLSTLSQTVHALTSLLYPFHWQHTYIPVLPESMIDIVCSPTPFLIGILTSNLPQVEKLPVEEIVKILKVQISILYVVIIDLDKKQLLRSQGDEGTLLPKKLQKAIKTVLNLCKIDSDQDIGFITNIKD